MSCGFQDALCESLAKVQCGIVDPQVSRRRRLPEKGPPAMAGRRVAHSIAKTIAQTRSRLARTMHMRSPRAPSTSPLYGTNDHEYETSSLDSASF